MSDFTGFEPVKGIPTGDHIDYVLPEEMTLFNPYPDNSIMTNEAVHRLVDQKIVIRVGNDVYEGRITQAINYPERNGYTIRLSDVQRRIQ